MWPEGMTDGYHAVHSTAFLRKRVVKQQELYKNCLKDQTTFCLDCGKALVVARAIPYQAADWLLTLGGFNLESRSLGAKRRLGLYGDLDGQGFLKGGLAGFLTQSAIGL